MGPPPLRYPEWFLRNVVDGRLMRELVERVARSYDDLYMEVVYRAHHNSFKVAFAGAFYNDFVDYVVKSCGLKKWFWKYLPEESTLRYMHERRRRFLRYLRKPAEKRKYHMFGDIKWSLEFWLSQLSFWHATVKAFASVWKKVVVDGKDIPRVVDWDEAITLYLIADFTHAAKASNYKAVKRKWIELYRKYDELEHSKT